MNITPGKNGKHMVRKGKRSTLASYGTRLGSSARATGQSALHQVQDITGKTRRALFPSKETLLGLGLITHLLRNREDEKVHTTRLTRKDVTDDFVEKLASALEKRLSRSGELKKALVEPLRAEVPRLRRLPEKKSSGMGWMTTLGMVAIAGYGLNYLIIQLTGKNVFDYATEQFNDLQQKYAGTDSEMGTPAGTEHRGYREIHRTAGAEMPDTRMPGRSSISSDPAQEEMGEGTNL